MPGLFDNALAYENARIGRESNNKAAIEQMREAAMLQRLMMQQAAISGRMQSGPGMMNAKRLQQKAADTVKENAAWMDALNKLPTDAVEPNIRRILDFYKRNATPELAKHFFTKYWPYPTPIKSTTVMGPDGMPTTEWHVEYPMTRSIGPVSGGAGAIGAPATTASTMPAGVSSAGGRTMEVPPAMTPSAKAWEKKYFGGSP